jgi:NADH-quinone oxidoreductase subunit J
MTAVFYISAFIAVAATLAAITRMNSVHALLYFILSLLAVGVIFFVLGAPFVAALIVIINAGAIMVLFVFIIMMVNQGPGSVQQEEEWTGPWLWIAPEFMAVILFYEFVYILYHSSHASVSGSQVIHSEQVGLSLFGPYLLGIELVSMILLVGLLGAHHLAWSSHVVKDTISGEK